MKKRPTFVPKKTSKTKSEDQVRKYWATHDSSEIVDWDKAPRVRFPDLKPSLRTISIRLPESMINDLKVLANERDVPYQSLIKVFLSERISRERR